MGETNDKAAPDPSGGKRPFIFPLILIILSAVVFFSFLKFEGIYSSQEARIAETAREMLESGDYIVPRLNGELRLQKPPLAYWVTAFSYRLFGRVDEFTVRFPSALFAVLTVIMTYFFTRRIFNGRAALISGAVLLSTLIFLDYGRSGRIESMLIFFMLSASVSFYLGWQRKKNKLVLYLIAFAFMGLALLAKGPIGLFPLATILSVLILKRRWDELKRFLLYLLPGLPILCFMGGLWYVVTMLKEPSAGGVFAGELLILFRGGGHSNPVFYYFYMLFLWFFPWFFLSVPVFFCGFRRSKNSDGLAYSLAWFFTGLFILSILGNKQAQYSLALVCPFAVLAGWFLDLFLSVDGSSPNIRRSIGIIFYLVSIVIFAALCILSLGTGKKYVPPPAFFPIAVGLVLILSAACFKLKKYRAAFWLVFIYTVLLLVPGKWLIRIKGIEDKSPRAFCSQAGALLPPDKSLYHFAPTNPAVVFYMRRVIPQLKSPHEIARALRREKEIYVIYEDRGGSDFPPDEGQILLEKRISKEKILYLMKFTSSQSKAAP